MSLINNTFKVNFDNISEKLKEIEDRDPEIKIEKLNDGVKKFVNDWYNLLPPQKPLSFLVIKIYTKIRKSKKYKNKPKKFRVIKYPESFLYNNCKMINVDSSIDTIDNSKINVEITFS